MIDNACRQPDPIDGRRILDLQAEITRLRGQVGLLTEELAIWRAYLPGYVYSPKGRCLYDVDGVYYDP